MIIERKEELKKMDAFVGLIVGRMKELHIEKDDVAAMLGINVRTFERKLEDPHRFKIDEIMKLSNTFRFDEHEVIRCFCFVKGRR